MRCYPVYNWTTFSDVLQWVQCKKIKGKELGFLAYCILYRAILICFPDFESQMFACTISVIGLTSQFYSFVQHIDAVNVGLKI